KAEFLDSLELRIDSRLGQRVMENPPLQRRRQALETALAFRPPLTRQLRDELRVRPQQLHLAPNHFPQSGLESPPQKRQQLVAHAFTLIARAGFARSPAKQTFSGPRDLFQLGPAAPQGRSHERDAAARR